MSNVLKGKVALVLEGTKGIGLASAKEFSIQGAKVFITGRNQREIDDAINMIGNDVTGLKADASNLAELDKVMSNIKRIAGYLDILVTGVNEQDCSSVDDVSRELANALALTSGGRILTVQKAIPLLKDGSSIIIVFRQSSQKANTRHNAAHTAHRSLASTWLLKLTPKARFVPVLF